MLETERLIIRPMKDEDALHLFELNSDPEVMRYTGDVASLNVADARRILTDIVYPHYQLHKMGRFTVSLKDGTYLGWCGLKFFPDNGEVDLGYRFLKRHWGKGYATESSRACLEYGFTDLKLKKIIARAMPENIGSIKVMQNLGMTFKGMDNDPGYASGFVRYEITHEEYLKCKK